MSRKKKINFFYKERIKKEEQRGTKTKEDIDRVIKVKDSDNKTKKIIINEE